MAFPEFAAEAENDRNRGGHVFVQCLPKMGSTALSRSVSNAEHEVDMDGAPLLMQDRAQSDFDVLRWCWLRKRRQALGTTIDICTSLFLLTAELSDAQLQQRGHHRLLLNRSLRPWLCSITNWSFQHASRPLRETWQQSYYRFVKHRDPDLAATMPSVLNDLNSAVRFWIPVWLLYQQWINTHTPDWRRSKRCLLVDDNTVMPILANRSQFSDAFTRRFDQLIPVMPSLTISAERHQAFEQDLRLKLLGMTDSTT